ncbi:MAG: hypothetical protein ACXW4B_10965 [Micavibrio sp.]
MFADGTNTVELATVDKVTVAGCQIDTAIYLTFSDFDEISICTLIHAAWGIVWPMLEKSGRESARDYFAEISNETISVAGKKLNQFSNFCKHSKDDSEDMFQFPIGITELIIPMVIDDFSRVSIKTSKCMDIYMLWFTAKHKMIHAPNYSEALQAFPSLFEMLNKDQRACGLTSISKVM